MLLCNNCEVKEDQLEGSEAHDHMVVLAQGVVVL